jgi:hypothetical protein
MNGFKFLGDGQFSEAYLNRADGTVLIKSVDPIKKAMASGKLPKCRLFPEIYYVGKDTRRIHLYRMPYYKILAHSNITHVLCKHDYDLYKVLAKQGTKTGIRDIIKGFKQLPDGFSNERDMLIEYSDSLYRTVKQVISFEVPDFNVASKDKKLILLDCFFPDNARRY